MCSQIVVVPMPHPGHIFPAIELANHLASRNYKITLFLPSNSTSTPLHRLITIVELSLPHPTHFPPHLLEDSVRSILAQRFNDPDCNRTLPICAIVDELVSWLIAIFAKLRIPAVSFFTSSACSAAMRHAASKHSAEDLTAGRTIAVPGLPEDFPLIPLDHAHHGPSPASLMGPSGSGGRGPRERGLAAASGAMALLVNTCDNVERPFLDYMAKESGKPIWGVGPLLPGSFWASAGSPVRDEEVRPRRESSMSEREVMEWLDSKPRRSVIYVSFGTLVSPTDDELAELAAGLSESKRPFIWVIQPEARRHEPDGHPAARAENGGGETEELARRAGGRGLVITGWAPQLAVLSHPATGGYVCHCGWNSAVEALVCGVPVLTWPVRGDQLHNARLLTSRLGVGVGIRGGDTATVAKSDVVRGIERLMGDEHVRKRAAALRAVFAGGFPPSSAASLNAFLAFVESYGQPK